MSASIEIPGYKLLSRIGEGSTAIVWRAHQVSLDREVAVKILKQQFADDTSEVQAFLREARAVAKLNSRHIVRIIDAGRHADTIYLVMEYVDGYPVQRLLSDGKPISQKQALNIALAIADALNEAWESEKIIHRDIKPANIILNRRGEVKVADLGLAGIVDAKGKLVDEDDGMIVGTPNYMSPEQAAGSTAMNFAADMYSLGAVLYHMLTGRLPFDGRDAADVLNAQLKEQIPHPCELNSKVTNSCAQLISRLMMKNPGQRHSDWSSVIDDINRILDGKMVIIKQSAVGESTVAARRDTTPLKKIPIRIAVSAAPAMPTNKTPLGNNKVQVSIWIRLPLQAAAALFFAWLLYGLLWVPYRNTRDSAVSVIPDNAGRTAVPAARKVPVPVAAPVRRAVSAHDIDPLDRVTVSTPVAQPQMPDDPPDRAMDRTLDSPPLQGDPQDNPQEDNKPSMLDILKNSIIHVAVSSGINNAVSLLEQNHNESAFSENQKQLDEMERLLSGSSRPRAMIAEQFRLLVGKNTYVNAGNRRVDFRVEAINGETVSVIVKASAGGVSTDYPAELKLETLEPAEVRRWLSMCKTPEAAFCIAVQDLSSGNVAGALEQADDCGPFAASIRQYAEKRIAALPDE